MSEMLKSVERGLFKDAQEAAYADESRWHHSTLLCPAARLGLVFYYARLLQLFGVLPRDSHLRLSRPLDILEPGCGAGMLSHPLSVMGNVWSFDYSSEAIRIAGALYGENRLVTFLEADGTTPEDIAGLQGKTFDVILMREFHPLSRHVLGNPRPADLVARYYSLVRTGGLIVIEHSLSPAAWRQREDVLDTSRLVRAFQGHLFVTDLLRTLLTLMRIRAFGAWLTGRPRLFEVVSNVLRPVVTLLCLMSRRQLSCTIVIQKPACGDAAKDDPCQTG